MLKTTGAMLGGGAVVAFGTSGTAQAAVEASDIDIPKATHSGEDGTVSDLTLSVGGSYQYSSNGATKVVLSLMVASEEGATDWAILDQSEESALAASSAGQYSLSGSILAHDQLSADMFSADPAETTTRKVPVMVALDIIKDGEAVVSAVAEALATVEVSNESVAVSAEVTGSGNVEIAV